MPNRASVHRPGQDHDGILPALREADGEQDYCDECGQLCAPYASTPLGRLLCKDCADAALAGPADDVSPLLAATELAKMRANAVAGTFDSLDFQSVLDHADEVTRRYEELVQTANAANDQAQIATMHRDEQIAALREHLRRIKGTLAYVIARVDKHILTPREGLEMVARDVHRHTSEG